MDVGSIVIVKTEVYPDSTRNEPVKRGCKGVIYSVLQENFKEDDECWFVIFQSGEAMDFNAWEQDKFLELTDKRISGSDKNKLHSKKLNDVIEDIKKKRIKL